MNTTEPSVHRIRRHIWVPLCGLVALTTIAIYLRSARDLKFLAAEREQLVADATAQQERLEKIENALHTLQAQQSSANVLSSAAKLQSLQPAESRLSALEQQVQNLIRATSKHPSGRLVPEYDPNNPLTASVENPVTNATPRRSWGPEQVTGPPDTESAGDLPTAWASRNPDGGHEWLSLDYANPIDIAEVRIRETYNPGAISRVAALVNGQEIVLWEGAASGGQAPRDFVVRNDRSIRAQSIVVHLDTTRVAGWNEIDSVELIGRDGSRQWAVGANASSTYAAHSDLATPLTGEIPEPIYRR